MIFGPSTMTTRTPKSFFLTSLSYMYEIALKESSTSSIEQLETHQLLSISNVHKSSENVEVENVANHSIA